jgi:hypothetical protein
MSLRLTLKHWASCHNLADVGIAGMSHHVQPHRNSLVFDVAYQPSTIYDSL